MAAVLIRYDNGKPAIQTGMDADVVGFKCQEKDCEAEYRIHVSSAEQYGIDQLRPKAQELVDTSHKLLGDHPSSIKLPGQPTS